ncbi:MAG TPA: HAMP domain-containing sensor histidine kinase [Pyrinomonadaceae bacterium]|jgi:signal transduction histidine kinase
MKNDVQINNVVRIAGVSVPPAIGGFVVFIALVIIFEWLAGVKIIARFSPNDSSMKVNVAIIFLLFGLGLFLNESESPSARIAAKTLTVGGQLIALLTLAQYLFGINLGIDQLIARDNPNAAFTSSPGRMSPFVALNFLLTGTALLLWRKRGKHNKSPREYFALVSLFMPAIVLVGYIFSASELYSFTTVTGIALFTAILFLILLSGILAVHSERGFTTILLSRTRGGLILRLLLPTSLTALILLYWIGVRMSRAGFISEDLVVPLGILGTGAVISFLIWRTARLLYDAEIKEKQTFAALQIAHRAAEEASRAKDEFISVVSHELRTPLNSILGWIKIIENSPGEANTRRAFEVIRRQSENQLQLIEDLLDTSRIITGKMRLEIKPLEIEDVITEAVETVRPAAEAKNINLIFEKSDAVKTLAGDCDRLQQVFWNLLSNSVKFTPRDGEIKIQAWREDSNIKIRIADTGDGIEADFLPFVFERFRQPDNTATHRSGGLGLGLSLVRNIVELHGGAITAESDGRGRGSTFTIRLPIKETH